MFIQRLRLNNLRCFEDIEITLDPPGSSLVILGDNNAGKSTLLRSLSMGLCDESSAAALFRELPGEFVRRKGDGKVAKIGDKATIEIDLISKKGEIYRIITEIITLKAFERVTQEHLYRIKKNQELKPLDQDSFPWNQIFVSGYGAGLRTQGTADLQEYQAVDAVYPLFKYDSPLQNPELVIRRIIAAARRSSRKEGKKRREETFRTIKRLLADILNLGNHDNIHLTKAGIEVKGRWGRAQLGEMGDGYRAIITWVLDLLSWWFLRASKGGWKVENISGIVLIDEIEKHLHPQWQRYLLSKLKEAFPKIQFIATTHSPLCAASTADLGENVCKLIRLKQSNGIVEAESITLPEGFRADQILTSEAFGLTETRIPKMEDMISKYYQLLRKPERTGQEESELKSLQDILAQKVPEAGQLEEERTLRDELRNLIETIKNLRETSK